MKISSRVLAARRAGQFRTDADRRHPVERFRWEVRGRGDVQLFAFEQADQAVLRARADRGEARDLVENRLEALAPGDHLQDARLFGEQVVERFAFTDVTDIEDDAVDRGVVEPVRDRALLPVPPIVAVAHTHDGARRLLGVLQHARPRCTDQARVVRVHVAAHEVAHERLRALSRQPFVRGTHVLTACFQVEDDDAVGRVLHERAKARLGRGDAGRGGASFGDVVHVDDDARDHRVVEQVRQRDLAPSHRTVPVRDADVVAHRSTTVFERVALAVAPDPFHVLGADDDAGIVAAHQVVHGVAGDALDRFGREDDRAFAVEHHDRVGRVEEQPPEAVFTLAQRQRRDLAVACTHPDDAHDEQEPGGHQCGDAVALTRGDDARRPAQTDRDLGAREADQAPHGRGEDGRGALDRDGLGRAENEAHRQDRAPAGRVDHEGDADDLQADAQVQRQHPGALPIQDRRRHEQRHDRDADEHFDGYGREDSHGPEPEQCRQRENGHPERLEQRPGG